jgi:uncharacterized protein with NRDE domain
MCTLAVAFQVDRRWPVVVAANRDERLARAAEGWAVRELPPGGGRYLAPRDAAAGGTWIGLSPAGLFAALTNFHDGSGRFPDPARRSRGELVPLALSAPTAAQALERVRRLDGAAYNPFHLLVAGHDAAFVWRHDGTAGAIEPLAPGLHVVTERSPDGRCPRGELVRARWPLDTSPARLVELLSIHGADRDAAICLHHGDLYGTRSSAVLRLAASLAHSELLAADGPPCVTPFEDRSELLPLLSRSA